MINADMVGENLRILRVSYNETQTSLGKEFGVANNTISGYESGKSRPEWEILSQYADYFGVSIDRILQDDLSEFVTIQAHYPGEEVGWEFINMIFPLAASEKAMENDDFRNGIRKWEVISDLMELNMDTNEHLLESAFEFFLKSANETKSPESVINVMRFYIFLQIQASSSEMIKVINQAWPFRNDKTFNKVLRQICKVSGDYLIKKDKELEEKYLPQIITLLPVVQNSEEWNELGAYYQILYIALGLTGNDVSKEQRQFAAIIGAEKLYKQNNPYIIMFYDFLLHSNIFKIIRFEKNNKNEMQTV